MVVYKRKKVGKYRSHTTHGGGHRKKRRGAGSRGGRGKAGSGKRAGHRKHLAIVEPSPKSSVSTINVGYFTKETVDKLLSIGKISEKDGLYVVDLAKLGFQKILGRGSLNFKLNINAQCSAKAAEKITAAGGKISSAEKALKVSSNKQSSNESSSNEVSPKESIASAPVNKESEQ